MVIWYSLSQMIAITWASFYFINSFKKPYPWATCTNSWNTGFASFEALCMHVKYDFIHFAIFHTDRCIVIEDFTLVENSDLPQYAANPLLCPHAIANRLAGSFVLNYTDATVEFWEYV